MNDPEPLIQKNGNAPAPSRLIEFDEFSFDTNKKLLRRGAEIVSLAPKACELLNALIANAPEVLSKEELMDLVWADTFVEESNLSQHISALRKMLGEDKNGKRFIETIPRKGYRFVAPIKEADDGAAEIVVSERTQTRLSEEIEVEAQELSPPPPPENIAQTKAISPSAPTARKNRRKTWLAGAFAVVVLAAVGYAVYQFGNRAAANFVAGKTTRLTTSGRVKSAAVSPDGKFVIYAQEELDDRQTLHLKHIGSESDTEITIPNIAEFRSLSISPDGNQLYFINENLTLYQVPVLGGMSKKIAEGVNSSASSGYKNIAFSPDGSQIAFARRFADEGSGLFIADANGGNERRIASFDTSILLGLNPAWSPDGKVIACSASIAGSGNILVFQVADGTYAKILSENWTGIGSPSWLSDSRSLLITGSRDSLAEQLWQISYPSGEARQITGDSSNYLNLNLTANNNFLTAVRNEAAANIWTMPARSANAARRLTTGFEKTDGVDALGWLPDSKIFYNSISSGNETIWSSRADGSQPRQIAKNTGMGSASPDGRYLVYQRINSPTNIGLWRLNLDDGAEEQITQGVDVHPAFTPDGKWMVFTRFGDEQVALLKVPNGSGGEPTTIYNEFVLGPAISPDGKTIAVNNLVIALIEFESGRLIKKFNVVPERSQISNLTKLQWTADGKGIYFVSRASGASNIWRQPVDEPSAPVQITDFKDGKIFNFAFSPDESQIALSRGVFNSDVVLIENGR